MRVEFILRAGDGSDLKESFRKFEVYVLLIALGFEGELSGIKLWGCIGEGKSNVACLMILKNLSKKKRGKKIVFKIVKKLND